MALIATELPADFQSNIAKNAGVLLKEFDTTSWTVTRSNIIGATTGGISFTDVPEYTDWGDDIDNCPKNTKELKIVTSREIKVSGTFVSADDDLIKTLVGASTLSTGTITPKDDIASSDFQDLWLVVDYGDSKAIAIEMNDVLNTSGFSFQTTDKAKGQFAFEFTAHYSIEDPSTVPYKVYIKA